MEQDVKNFSKKKFLVSESKRGELYQLEKRIFPKFQREMLNLGDY